MMQKPGKYTFEILFVVIFIALFFLLGYNNLLSSGPMSMHAWRQSDSYSFALTYFYENNKLLEPSILFTGEDGHGKAISEFPIIYFLTAKIWKLTGVTPAVLKFINFIILLTGLFHLALLSRKVLKDNFWSLFIVFILFSSPILGYYSFNFIPNIPAFGLALTGLYYLYRFAETEKNRYILIVTLLFSFSSLIKVTSLISLLGATFVLSLHYLKTLKKKKVVMLKLLLAVFIIFLCYFSWYKYSVNYNAQNLNGVFNQSALPIWKLDKSTIADIWDKFYFNVLPMYFNRVALLFFFVLFLASMFFRRNSNWRAIVAGLTYFVGFVGFLMVFFKGIRVHDYFLINTLIFIPAMLISILIVLKNKFGKLYNSKIGKIIGLCILIWVMNGNIILTRCHYNPYHWLVKYNIPLSEKKMEGWKYNYYKLELNEHHLQGIDKYLDELGIDYNSKMIVVGDITPNQTLCYLHRRGFQEYHYKNNYKEKERMERMIEIGATHIVINNTKEPGEITKSFLTKKVGDYNKISLYQIDN